MAADLALAPCYEELSHASQSCKLKLKMVDCLQSRYIDLYCVPVLEDYVFE